MLAYLVSNQLIIKGFHKKEFCAESVFHLNMTLWHNCCAKRFRVLKFI